jgi:hypothetical protein
MFNTGPWRWIMLFFLWLSTAGQQWDAMSKVILKYNLLFGLQNDLYDDGNGLSKLKYLRYQALITIIAPAFAGFLIDKTRRPGLGILIFNFFPTLAVLLPLKNGRTSALQISYEELTNFGASALLVCEIVILSKWFKGQYSLPIVYAVFFYLGPAITLGILLGVWKQFVIQPDPVSLKGNFDFQYFDKLELYLHLSGFACGIIVAILDYCADWRFATQKKKLMDFAALKGTLIYDSSEYTGHDAINSEAL